jgi:Protein of unknown function (DUF4197)
MAGRALIAWVMVLALATSSGAMAAGWKDTLEGAADSVKSSRAGSAPIAGLSNSDMTGGLKEALAVGAERAIKGLGRQGGYLDDPAVRIPLPGVLKKTEKALRMMGKDKAVDDFLVTVNRAAEKAIPQASAIVGDAVRGMSIADAKAILTGPDDSATQFFREKTTPSLTDALLPIVKRATESAGVTRSYKNMIGKAGPAAQLAGDRLDLDAYVTRKTLAGLFTKLADEERAIRTDPVARSSDLLKKVFGAVKR